MKAEIIIGGVGVTCALASILLGIYIALPWPAIGALTATSIGIASISLVVEKEIKKRKESVFLKIGRLTLTPYWYSDIEGCKDIKGFTGAFEVANEGKKIAYNLTAEISMGRLSGYYAEILEPSMMEYITKKLHTKKVDIEDIHELHASKIEYEWVDEDKNLHGDVFPKLRQDDVAYVSFPKGISPHIGWGKIYPRSLLLVSGRKHSAKITIKAEDSEKNTIIKKRTFEFVGPAEDDGATIFLA